MKNDYLNQKMSTSMKNSSSFLYGMSIQKDRHIALNDGTRLMADLYLPDPCEGVFPALLCYSPFGKEVQSMTLTMKPLRVGQFMYDETNESCDIAYFVRHGYAVVIANPRGIGNSEGANHGLLSEQDQKDCCEVITWISKQPFCSGAVGMMGTGWAGRIQPLVAARQPAPLKAIMPIDLIDDLYEEYYPGGATTDYHFAVGGSIPANRSELDAVEEMGLEGVQKKLEELRKRPEMAEMSSMWRDIDSWPPRSALWTIDCLIHDRPGPFWEKRSDKGKASQIKIPVYAVSFYSEYKRDAVSAFSLYNDPDLKTPKKLLMVNAGINRCNPCHSTSEEMLRWYDYWLKGIDTGIMKEPPIKLFIMGEEKFRYEYEWPLRRACCRKLYLEKGNLLTFDAPIGKEETDELYHQPPTKVSQYAKDIPYLRYETVPFNSDTELTGPLSADFYLSVDQPSAMVLSFVYDVAPDGTRLMISSNIKKHYAVQLGVPEKCHIELVPIVCMLKKGHNLRLDIKAMDYPVYNPREKRTFSLHNSGRFVGPVPSTLFTHYHMYHDEEHPSHLLVYLVENSDPKQWIMRKEERERGNC